MAWAMISDTAARSVGGSPPPFRWVPYVWDSVIIFVLLHPIRFHGFFRFDFWFHLFGRLAFGIRIIRGSGQLVDFRHRRRIVSRLVRGFFIRRDTKRDLQLLPNLRRELLQVFDELTRACWVFGK